MSGLRRRSARLKAVEEARSKLETDNNEVAKTTVSPKFRKGRRSTLIVQPLINNEALVSADDGIESGSNNSATNSPVVAKTNTTNLPTKTSREGVLKKKPPLPRMNSKRLQMKEEAKSESLSSPDADDFVLTTLRPRRRSQLYDKPPASSKAANKRTLDSEEKDEMTKEVMSKEHLPELSKKRKSEVAQNKEHMPEISKKIESEETKNEEELSESSKKAKSEVEEEQPDRMEDDSINFGNSSNEDDNDDDFQKKKMKTPRRTAMRSKRASALKARNSLVAKFNDSQSSMSSSSSSSDSDMSVFEPDAEDDEIKKAEMESAEEISFGNEVDEDDIGINSDEDFVPRKSVNSRSSNGRASRGANSKSKSTLNSRGKASSRSSKTSSRCSNGTNKNSKATGGRTHIKKKVAQPWQKNISFDDPRSMRKLSSGERKMLEFRLFAAKLAVGKIYEMPIEEAAEIVFQFREQAKKAKTTLLIEGNSEKPEAEANSSDDEDDWEEMETFDCADISQRVQITVEKKKVEPDWWAFYLRQEVNKCIRETWENTHKAHLLCYIAHLQFIHKTVTAESLIPSLILTQTPEGLMSLVGEPCSLKSIKKITNWYTSTYQSSLRDVEIDANVIKDVCYRETARYSTLVNQKKYETDLDRSALLFALFHAFEYVCRICVNVRPITRSWNEETINSYVEQKDKNKKKMSEVQDYWVEVWEHKLKRWICVNPSTSVIDEPNGIEKLIGDPISYIFAIDNKKGVREVTPRYASDYVKPLFRRRRTDKPWLIRTFRKKTLIANTERSQLEDVHFKTELVMRPLPTSLAEFKNHPLYVLEKDLLKFQALYPPIEKQKPIGTVKGHNVYPRDTVYLLQNEKRWEKMARSIKKGEKPYKIVKALTDPRIPIEEREPTFVGIYGFWQTVPFKPPSVKNGKIPRNEFGNVYIYQPSMIPIGTVHLKLTGLPNIARKLDKECAPAVVGWDFHSCSNYPIIEGACVLEEDADLFVREWNKHEAHRIKKESTKRQEHAYENWKKLIKGILRLQYVKSRFGPVGQSKPSTKDEAQQKCEASSSGDPRESTVIDRTKQASTIEFTLDRLTK